MLVSMSLKQNEHGVWCVRKKVPERLASATAQILANGSQGNRGYNGHSKPRIGERLSGWRRPY
jgi:hypothetical protein